MNGIEATCGVNGLEAAKFAGIGGLCEHGGNLAYVDVCGDLRWAYGQGLPRTTTIADDDWRVVRVGPEKPEPPKVEPYKTPFEVANCATTGVWCVKAGEDAIGIRPILAEGLAERITKNIAARLGATCEAEFQRGRLAGIREANETSAPPPSNAEPYRTPLRAVHNKGDAYPEIQDDAGRMVVLVWGDHAHANAAVVSLNATVQAWFQRGRLAGFREANEAPARVAAMRQGMTATTPGYNSPEPKDR